MRALTISLIAVGVSLTLAACSDDTDGTGTGSTTNPTTTSATGTGGSGGSGGEGTGGSGGQGGSGETANVTTADLVGTWKSEACESGGPMNSVLRTFVIDEKNWSVEFSLFGGTMCEDAAKLFTAKISGEYTLGKNSAAVAGAQEGEFGIASAKLTPHAAGLDFVKMQCPAYNWMLDGEQDVTKDGCGIIVPSSMACSKEYDLVAIVNGKLFFGDRSQPLCSPETRPTKLSAGGLVKG